MTSLDELKERINISKSMSGIIRIVNRSDELLSLIIDDTNFLNNDVNLKQRIYHIRNGVYKRSICSVCNENERIWDNKHSRYRNWCSDDCKKIYMKLNRDPLKEKERVEKIKETKKRRYGSETYNNREKARRTCIERYGVDSFSKTDLFNEKMINKIGAISPFSYKEIRDKAKKTLYKNYGVSHNSYIDEVVQKRTETFLKRYGTKTASENKDIRDKIINTNIKRYGFRSPMLNDDILRKSYGDYKEYRINGKLVNFQGYEDYVYYEILAERYKIDDIIIDSREITKYTNKIIYEMDGRTHRYFPDFYIKSNNKIIEVKSPYTYESDIERNLKKRDACIELGLGFEFIIIENSEYMKWERCSNK